MDLTYDQKFEDMKKYIPFLESMIQRLESGQASANPRQAQLDKIRSLRDLLVDKKKRMKMENLLKCEQVLVNLYAKVEQREPGFKVVSDMSFPLDTPKEKDDTDLSIVRNKLKIIVSKTNLQAETLPEIARASETEELCTPGSKEPALFQRRPNKSSISPSASERDEVSPHNSRSKRTYTRLLKSPERSSNRWANQNPSPNKPLFSRRSPRKSPSYYKKERKKSSNQAKKYKAKDLNITLNVPEESLNSLNTDDILSRIINCSNGDVDISTLRDLRSQILGELKHTGAHEDISDLIMKSYKKKKKTKNKAKVEVEEGELSDSESEAIESIYGSLVLVDKDKNVSSEVKTSAEKEKQRKIQICLVINSDKDGVHTTTNTDKKDILSNATVTDVSELEMFDLNKPTIEEKKLGEKQMTGEKIENTTEVKKQHIVTNKQPAVTERSNLQVQDSSQGIISIDDNDTNDNVKKPEDTRNIKDNSKESDATCVDNTSNTSVKLLLQKNSEGETIQESSESIKFTANFYKPLNDQITDTTLPPPVESDANEEAQLETFKPTSEANTSSETVEIKKAFSDPVKKHVTSVSNKSSDKNGAVNNEKEIDNINSRISTEDVEIPLLNLEPVVPAPPANQLVSEIDILQALKNEILSDSIAIPGSEAVTPPLHQPKITKVSSAQEITKKRISIEKYKEIVRKPLHRKHSSNLNMRKDDHSKKQSLKLTEKECERFNLPAKKISLGDSSDEDEVAPNYSLNDIYGDLNAPKSPENDDIFNEGSVTPPIIIPEDPIKTAIVNPASDVDMRTIMPILSPNSSNPVPPVIAHTAVTNKETLVGNSKSERKIEQNYIPPLMDPRLKLDVNKARESPNPHLLNPERTPRPLLNFPNMTPIMTPSRIPSMTPNARTFEMTPSHKSFEIEENLSNKHVYAPIFQVYEQRDAREVSMTRDNPIQHNWELNNETNQDTRKSRWEHGDFREGNSRNWEDHHSRATSVHRESASDYQNSRYNDTSDKHSENSISDRFGYDKRDGYSFSRLDCPRTPVHLFGRSDCPTTPTPSFGRMETPLTPVHSFGRSDCPSTPNHPFGRSDPTTPSHSFGRSDMNAPMTPSHQFGRSEYPEKAKYVKDPRLNRSSEHEASPRHYGDDRDRNYYKADDGRNSDGRNRPFNSSDNYSNYTRDQTIGRSNRSYDKSGRYFNREQTSYREPNVGRGGSRNYESDRFYGRERIDPKQDYRYEDDRRGYNEAGSRRTLIQRAPSVGRSYDEAYKTSSRAPSVGRNYDDAATDNTLSVKPQSGRSFIIDTSVNRTFQEFLSAKGLFDHTSTFDARRKRATSVERSLARSPSVGRTFRESSVGRNLSKPSHLSSQNPHLKNRNQFVRAKSVGRELANAKQEKSFKDLKAELKSYSASYKTHELKHNVQLNDRKMNYRSPRCRKDIRELKQSLPFVNTTKSTYSPTKNNRDPRMRRDYQNDTKRYRTEDRNRDGKSYGIVYSSDNIAKGTILGPGYGVKNYKIPKIKRVVEEKQETEEVVEQKENTSKSKVDEKKQIKDKAPKDVKCIVTDNIKKQDKNETKIVDKDKSQSKDTTLETEKQNHDDACKSTSKNNNKRLTRSSLNSSIVESDLSSEKVTSKPRRFKKAVIYDSDSDGQDEKTVRSTLTDSKECSRKNESESTAGNKSEEIEKPENEMLVDSYKGNKSEEIEKPENEMLVDSFGVMEDLEVFPDNMVCDNMVMDNINALIADLDNDLDNSKTDKNDQFTNEITLENMLENITNLEQPACTVDESLYDLDELINEDLNKVETNLKEAVPYMNENVQLKPKASPRLSDNGQHSVKTTQEKVNKEMVTSTEAQTTLIENSLSPYNESDDSNKSNNYPIVSTTEIENQPTNKLQDKVEELVIQNSVNISSAPDSTINTEESVQAKPCDSTNEIHPDITSIYDSAEILGIANNTDKTKEKNSQIESIGNLLSILQDKSKIKELLGMLGGPSIENEKIKKKLEKLSEIVSDDEDSNNLVEQKVMPKEIDTSKNVENSILGTMETIESKDVESKAEIIKSHIPESIEDHKPKIIDDKPVISEKKYVESKAKGEALEKSVTNLEKEERKKCNETSIELLEKAKIADSNEPIREDIEDSELSSEPSRIQKSKVAGKIKRKGKKRKIKRPHTHIRHTSPASSSLVVEKPKKASRELRLLQDDIKEMFISDDILNATGIRMCRLAKLVDEKTPNQEEVNVPETRPVVVLEKVKDHKLLNNLSPPDKARKKPGPKPKVKPKPAASGNLENDTNPGKAIKHKPGPKSKTRPLDPYIFESDTFSETSGTSRELPTIGQNNTQQTKCVKKLTDALLTSSDSESDSLASIKSFGSSEPLTDLKKKIKRKRGGWKAGFIKPNKKKKKIEAKQIHPSLVENATVLPQKTVIYPDMNCFTDKTYCFVKNITIYPCRLCDCTCRNIVDHYKRCHPHSEIPLSRMNPTTAQEAIEQCEETDFQAISKIVTDKYVCRFCYKEFNGRRKTSILEAFFWHVVSIHTGEYRQLCSECINVDRCPFNLDIPPPPKEVKGQLIGYICGKCNFTQISLENLKTHVIVRHNDEQTEVYTINLAVMTKKTVNTLMNQSEESPRVLRSTRSNQSANEASDARSDITGSTDRLSEIDSTITKVSIKSAVDSDLRSKVQSNISFEQDDCIGEVSHLKNTERRANLFKTEKDNESAKTHKDSPNPEPDISDTIASETVTDKPVPSDVADYAHFKISYTDTGAKEYVCCINNIENHYKTNLLISMKKHVQTKHIEKWDGYCFLCKNIVTSQGKHDFRECLQHILDKHTDNLPLIKRSKETEVTIESAPVANANPAEKSFTSKNYINVRPMSELLSKEVETPSSEEAMPKIQNVISLRNPSVESPVPSEQFSEPTSPDPEETPILTSTREKSPIPESPQKYEEAQDEIMRKKHQVVLESMKSPDKLIKIFKCSGRYCYFTSDNIDDALLHASTHQRIGGENALLCSYCDFDCSGNAIALVMHVFKSHGHCQFSCAHCFYRAAASQLVRAHMIRIHGEQFGSQAVLKTETITPGPSENSDILERDAAVQYYICAEDEENCNFKTYIQVKFSDHLMKHTPPHTCHICSTKHPSSMELILHMKSHGMKVFQCAWCVFGVDNEPELLFHCSEKHPSKQPQAYMRIITTKDNRLMVLPVAQYNKSPVLTKVVSPGIAKDHPIREAETSIELEKLIGSMALISEPLQANIDAQPEISTDTAIQDSNEIENVPPLIPLEPRLVTPPPSSSVPDDLSQQVTPVLKTEPLDETPAKNSVNKDVILCLDSDEDDKEKDDSSQMVIDLSDDDIVLTAMDPNTAKDSVTPGPDIQKKIPLHLLYQCPKCSNIYKTSPAFKRHFQQCFPNIKNGSKCAHCSAIFYKKTVMYDHYEKDHRLIERDIPHRGAKTRDPNAPNPNILPEEGAACGICEFKHRSVAYVKSHLKTAHGISNPASSYRVNGELVYIARELERRKPGPKRKLSSGIAAEPPAKRKRYGPQDVHLLPTKPILDELVFCSLCEFSTKVRLNLVRHLQGHADKQPVAETVPVNPVPHLETNEKHFDKMVNLASSSIVTRAPEKSRVESTPTCLQLPPDGSPRYPSYVPDRQRHACGAKGCSYISVDEEMLKRHWETLHEGSNDFHCVHCPPNQSLDKTKPISALRISAHLKMHDTSLYACSICPYYHFKKQILEKHVIEAHTEIGQVKVVREEWTASPMGASQGTAPTMDLKPWQCGLCKFKSMLRQEVVEHCAKIHSSKMQFKCPNCPFRTSTIENVKKHHSNSHPSSTEDVIYYYYREGSIPEEPDGTSRWMKQRQKMGLVEPEVKAEVDAPSVPATPPFVIPTLASDALAVDLNIVKKETEESQKDLSTEDLCKKFGQFCNPNGLKFKCPLCSVVMEDTKDDMQSHLFEELKYRKWGCCFCSYKAFHQTGLNEHIFTEHNRQKGSPKELPVDKNVEKWVSELLDHQAALIVKVKENFAKQRIQVEKPRISAPQNIQTPTKLPASEQVNTGELIQAFGDLGTSKDLNFYCPKCTFSAQDESAMRDHLESELNKIRWRCSNCNEKYQEYHEAQIHCRTVHAGQSARPVEAIRDPAKRTAWLDTVIRTQKTSMPARREIEEPVASIVPPSLDNSLLVVRYEERVPTPEEEMLMRRKIRPTTPVAPAAPDSSDSDDDDRLVIGDPLDDKPKSTMKKCPHCDLVTKYSNTIREHIYRHYNLKPFMCTYCDFSGYLAQVRAHKEVCHPNQPHALKRTPKPTGPPLIKDLSLNKGKKMSSVKVDEREGPTVICLVCEKLVGETQTEHHIHNKMTVQFAKKGDVVVKCCNCLALLLDVEAMKEHHHVCHSNAKINYAFYKLHYDTRQIHCCGHCRKRFKFLRDLRSHHNAVHSAQAFQYTMRPYTPVNYDDVIDLDEESAVKKKSTDDAGPALKRVAKKSTTKLPAQTVAKKSTTKLPFQVESDSETIEDDYSYYGTKPTSLQQYSNVTTMMPFCNTVMPFTVKKLSEIININTKIVVKDFKNNFSD